MDANCQSFMNINNILDYFEIYLNIYSLDLNSIFNLAKTNYKIYNLTINNNEFLQKYLTNGLFSNNIGYIYKKPTKNKKKAYQLRAYIAEYIYKVFVKRKQTNYWNEKYPNLYRYPQFQFNDALTYNEWLLIQYKANIEDNKWKKNYYEQKKNQLEKSYKLLKKRLENIHSEFNWDIKTFNRWEGNWVDSYWQSRPKQHFISSPIQYYIEQQKLNDEGYNCDSKIRLANWEINLLNNKIINQIEKIKRIKWGKNINLRNWYNVFSLNYNIEINRKCKKNNSAKWLKYLTKITNDCDSFPLPNNNNNKYSNTYTSRN